MSDPNEFAQLARDARVQIKMVAAQVSMLHQNVEEVEQLPSGGNHEEMHANITLAYRHLEDAAMRMGKAIQAYDGGVSVYDK